MGFLSKYITSVYILIICLGVTFSTYAHAQQSSLQSQLPNEIMQLEQRMNRQVDSVMLMIKLAGGVVAFIGAGLTIGGVGSYRTLLREIREKHQTRLRDLEQRASQLSGSLEKSQQLLHQTQQLFGIYEDSTPSVLFTQAEESLASNHPDLPKAVGLIAKIASYENATADELTAAGLFARQKLGSSSLARRLFAAAVQKPEVSDLARAIHAELCAGDPNWKEHEKTLLAVLDRNPYDESAIKAAGNFYIERDDWPALEDTMRRAAERAPWLSTPHRVRARAAERMRKNHTDIVDFYEKAIACSQQPGDFQTFSWYASYLFNNGSYRSDEDLAKAEKLLRQALSLDPANGTLMVQLARVLSERNQPDEMTKYLEAGMLFTSSAENRREVAALLTLTGQLPKIAPLLSTSMMTQDASKIETSEIA
jgi:tetratricopeptide (TPR) repeat protein